MKHFKLIICLGILMFCASCNENSSQQNSDSELIIKVNAVQEQIMVQGNITKEEEQAMLSLCAIISHDDGLANFSPENRMILKDVEIVPIYEGCEGLSKEETKECFKNKIRAFIKREFNVSLSKDLNLSEPKQVDAFFIIDQTGNRTGMKVRDSEVTIQAEILRVLRKMPVMKPARHNGEDVSVLCSVLIKYGNKIEVDVVYIPERPNN
ncbi:hypothetical protein [Winogradskyella sp. PG-2]|uniref:hypothetical protein n=1 Tax=Winogradskyella sp. PG-2 TaxID=754409 RepID=UPI0005F0AB33|nr:hypothetical protein [Winogradskyella sp. PG-2]